MINVPAGGVSFEDPVDEPLGVMRIQVRVVPRLIVVVPLAIRTQVYPAASRVVAHTVPA